MVDIAVGAKNRGTADSIARVSLYLDEISLENRIGFAYVHIPGGEGAIGGAFFTLNTTGLTGTHGLIVTVYDSVDPFPNFNRADIDIEIFEPGSNLPPEVSITSHDDLDEVTDTITLAGTASDPDGDETLQRVEVSIGGEAWEEASGTTTWNREWDTTTVENGTHQIRVRAFDGDDFSDIMEITLIVWNEGGPGPVENTPPDITLVSPGNGSDLDVTTVTFTWNGEDDDGDDLEYTLYLDENTVPVTQIGGDLSDEYFEFFDLVPGTTYYWKVVVTDGKDETESGIWNLYISDEAVPGNNLPTIVLLNPLSGQIIVEEPLTLVWRGDDDDNNDILTYDVYLGTDLEALTLVSGNQTTQLFTVLALKDGTTYYWNIVVKDGKDSVASEMRNFTVDLKDDGSGDDDFEIAGIDGYVFIGLIATVAVVVIIVIFMIVRRRTSGEDYDYDYDEYEDYDEDYDDEEYDGED